MTILQVIGAVFQLILLILPRWFKSRDEKKKELKEAYKDGVDAIKKRNPTLITASFDRINRLR